MSPIKQKMTEIIQSQPDDSSFEEILRELAFARMVERGLEDSRTGRTISNEEIRERLLLVDRILEVVNQPTQEEIDRLWAEEAERRIDELDSGGVEEIPGEQVFTEIRERLGK